MTLVGVILCVTLHLNKEGAMYLTYDIYFAFVEEFQPHRFKELAIGGIETVRDAINSDVEAYNRKMTQLIEEGYSEGRARDVVNEIFFTSEEVEGIH